MRSRFRTVPWPHYREGGSHHPSWPDPSPPTRVARPKEDHPMSADPSVPGPMTRSLRRRCRRLRARRRARAGRVLPRPRDRSQGDHRDPLDGPRARPWAAPASTPTRRPRTRSATSSTSRAGCPTRTRWPGSTSAAARPSSSATRPTDKTEALLRAYGRFVQSLNGRYLTACDVGTYSADMDVVARECDFVTGRTVAHGGAGDSSVLTAYGVFQGMRASAEAVWGTPTLSGRTVGVAGVGKVGHHLVKHLVDDGARVVVTDVNPAAVEAMVARVRRHRGRRRRRAGAGRDRRLRAVRAGRSAHRRGRRRADREDRLRRGQQPARAPGHREGARRPRHPLRARLLRELRRRHPGRRRARGLQLRARRAARRAASSRRPRRCSRWPRPTRSRRPRPPTGSPSGGCATSAGSAGSGYHSLTAGRPPPGSRAGSRRRSLRHSAPAPPDRSVLAEVSRGTARRSPTTRRSGSSADVARLAVVLALAVQLAGQRPEVRLVSAVLQVAGDLRLLGFRSAAPHRVDPLALWAGATGKAPWHRSDRSFRRGGNAT